jgi:hypothetical protein
MFGTYQRELETKGLMYKSDVLYSDEYCQEVMSQGVGTSYSQLR